MSVGKKKIAFIANKMTSITSEMIEELSQKGIEARLICPEDQLIDIKQVRIEDDLYVIKSVGHLGLGLAGSLHAAGANMLNPYPAVALIKHKVGLTQVLHSAGVPVPDTFTSTSREALLPLLKKHTLIAKPFDGSRSKGIVIIRTPDELLRVPFGEFLMVQRYCRPDEENRFTKAYYLDGRIFFIKRWWSEDERHRKDGELIESSPVLSRIVQRCARILKIKLFGVDMVISQGMPVVVDIQEFGSFTGVPNAATLLTNFIISNLVSK